MPRLERVWSNGDAEAALREAVELVERVQPPDDLRPAVFNYAAQLVTQRVITPTLLDQARR